MSDSFTEVTNTGYGKRLKGAFGGIIVGLIMFVAAFPVTWWNEGRAVRQRQSLTEGAGAVVSVDVARLDPANENKLVHVSGPVEAEGPMTDDEFGVSIEALGLRRRVAMYQWVEKKESKERKKFGGGTETVTTYRYEKDWDDEPIDSSDFKQSSGHANPGAFPLQSRRETAPRARMGAFAPESNVLRELQDWRRLKPTANTQVESDVETDVELPEGFRISGDSWYRGDDPAHPQVGDVRVRIDYVPEGVASIVARQSGKAFEEYETSVGNTIFLVETGAKTAAEMFAEAQRANTVLAWIIRGLGFVLMWIGLGLILRPLSVVLDVIPLLGSLVSKGVGFVAGLVAFICTAITIGMAWLWYRPLLGIAMLALAVGAIVWLRGRRQAPAGAVPVVTPPPPPAPMMAPPPPPPPAPRTAP